VGYIEAVTGIGLIIGPIIGSTLYHIGGFAFTFFAFGSMFVIFMLFVKKMFPKRIDEDSI